MAVASHLLLDFPWLWGFMLGFVLAAVSPAVVVPCLLQLQVIIPKSVISFGYFFAYFDQYFANFGLFFWQ